MKLASGPDPANLEWRPGVGYPAVKEIVHFQREFTEEGGALQASANAIVQEIIGVGVGAGAHAVGAVRADTVHQ